MKVHIYCADGLACGNQSVAAAETTYRESCRACQKALGTKIKKAIKVRLKNNPMGRDHIEWVANRVVNDVLGE